MRCRYAIAFGRGAPRHSLLRKASEASLNVRADWPNLLVVADDGTPVQVIGDNAIVGELFACNESSAAHSGEGVDGGNIASDPAGLARSHWGPFALFSAAEDQLPTVYRDPSGAVPVYQHERLAEGIFISDAEIAKGLGLADKAAVDFNFVLHWLQFPFLRAARTGIEQFTEVLPGIGRTRRDCEWGDALIWTPGEYASRDAAILDPREAADRLRKVALSAVSRQIRGPVLLQLSGGLDSSILAACLHEANIPFTGVNFATRSADGDERRYARTVAELVGAPLLELEEEQLPVFARPERLSFRPATNPLLAPFEQAVDRCAEETGALAIVDGGGGDNLFCYLNSAAPVIDALCRAGPHAAARAVDDIAARAGCSSWEVMRSAARRARRQRHWSRWKEDRKFLKPEVLLPGPEAHPWTTASAGCPPGKSEHVEALVHVQHFLDRTLAPSRSVLHPLMARPLLELCLRIPSWLWMAGGRDRAIARDAFKGLVPELVLQRRTKGSLQGLFHRSFGRHRGDIQELLLTGELRKAGILDAPAIEDAFRTEANDELIQLRLSEMAAMELWLQSWRA